MKGKIRRKIKARTGDPLYEDIEKSWNEITFIKPGDTDVERMNRTYLSEKDDIKKRIVLMREKLQKMYGYRYPIQRRVLEERIHSLEKQFLGFEYIINPYHIQPGLLLDVDITSIKRKKATLDGMANVLNEFLFGVSKGFQDAAFASFSRRRSTVRTDIQQSFATDESVLKEREEYAAMLNVPSAVAAKPASEGVVDTGRRASRAKPAAKRGGSRGRSDDALREI